MSVALGRGAGRRGMVSVSSEGSQNVQKDSVQVKSRTVLSWSKGAATCDHKAYFLARSTSIKTLTLSEMICPEAVVHWNVA